MRLLALDIIDSTNAEARRLAENGEAHGLVIYSKRQMKGRGRRGREWVSDPGNLYCSILLRPDYPAEKAMELSFVAAVAMADAVQQHLPRGTFVDCKWPNDILIEGKKVAGILLESGGIKGDRLDWLVVGVGLNIEHFPDATQYPATCMNDEGAGGITVESMLQSFCNRFHAAMVTWHRLGFAAIRRQWVERAYRLGKIIRVNLHNETLDGVFKDVDDTGALILSTGEGTRRITAGDVFMPVEAEG